MSLVFASPLSNAAKDSSNDNRIQDTRNFLPSSDQVNILPSPNQVSVLQPPYNEISALSSKPQKSSRYQEKHRIDLMKQYILTWLSFACPTVGLTIPSCVFKATNWTLLFFCFPHLKWDFPVHSDSSTIGTVWLISIRIPLKEPLYL